MSLVDRSQVPILRSSNPTRPSTRPGALPVTYDDVLEAAERLEEIVRRTPVITSAAFSAACGAEVFFKCEPFQRTGSFKFRGAFNACVQLSAAERKLGVLAYSSGNHAQAVALACSMLSIPATVVMPDDAPRVKIDATRGYGAEVILFDPGETTREDLGTRLAQKRGLRIIPPYDHPDVVAGQGTAALELFEEVEALDALLVPCGGGGLLSGTAVVTKAILPTCTVVGVEPERADDATRSFQTGALHTVQNPDTVADGVRTPSLGRITFPLVLKLVDQMITVSEQQILDTMRFIWERMKIVVEPTGAVAAAALLSGKLDVLGARAGVILSGGNVDLEKLGI